MPILIDDKEIEAGLDQFIRLQPTETSRASMTRAIVRRALKQPPDDLQRWLWEDNGKRTAADPKEAGGSG